MWYNIENTIDIYTPSILIFPDRVEENIRTMICIAGDPARLRPHVKTHKLGEIVQLQVQYGINKFKCATITEMLMVAENGGKDILLSYPLLGPGVSHLFEMKCNFPDVKFAVTVDSQFACQELIQKAIDLNTEVDVFIDIDNGMHRTGIEPKDAKGLAQYIVMQEHLNFAGLHIYDGHIHEADKNERAIHCKKDFECVDLLIKELKSNGIQINELVGGGTFTFPIHAKYPTRTLSPGTPLFWDAGYKNSIPDLDFLPAAILAGRVISKPKNNVCIDFGYKSVASEMSHPRVQFLDIDVKEVINHSEEHLVVSSPDTDNIQIGDVVFALPQHVCPTVALHEEVYVVKNKRVEGTWKVLARKRNY